MFPVDKGTNALTEAADKLVAEAIEKHSAVAAWVLAIRANMYQTQVGFCAGMMEGLPPDIAEVLDRFLRNTREELHMQMHTLQAGCASPRFAPDTRSPKLSDGAQASHANAMAESMLKYSDVVCVVVCVIERPKALDTILVVQVIPVVRRCSLDKRLAGWMKYAAYKLHLSAVHGLQEMLLELKNLDLEPTDGKNN